MLPSILEETLEVKKMKLDLNRFAEFEAKAGRPSLFFQSLHVAGTNGKGTVAYKLAAALESLGKKVGFFTSPHIHTYHERIQINRTPITENAALRILTNLKAKISEELTYFEMITLLAFQYFAEECVDIAVLEVGMGGRLDTTNIVTPLLSIITSIGKDHTKYLGKTLKEIAFEKAGIIKPKVPVVIGPRALPRIVFEKIAKERESVLHIVKNKGADYEEENVAVVLKALSLLPFSVTDLAIETAMNAKLPCRFDEVYPHVIFDVGHNPPALKRTFEKIALRFPGKKIRVLAAFSSDKEIGKMLSFLEKHAIFTHLTQANHPRAWNIFEKKRLRKNMDLNLQFGNAFEKGFSLSKERGEIFLVCGTFFIMHEALAKLDWVRSLG